MSRASIWVGRRGPRKAVTRSPVMWSRAPIWASTSQTALSPWREAGSIPFTVTLSPPNAPRHSQGAALDQSPSTWTRLGPW